MTISSKNRAFWPAIFVGVSAMAAVETGLGEGVNHSSGSSSSIESEPGESKQSGESSLLDTGLGESGSETITEPEHSQDDRANLTVLDVDEDTADKIAEEKSWVRENTTRRTESTYSLLFDHLELDSQEKSELLSLLVEDGIARLWTSYKDGIEIDRDEQSKRIAAIIGDAKLQQFRGLEQNIRSYWELDKIASMLEKIGAPLSETQRDKLLTILIETRIQDQQESPPDAKTHCIEYLEYRLSQLDEHQRHVMELASSALSPQQVVYLHKLYEHQSNRRTKTLELRKWREVHDPTTNVGCWYPGWSDPRWSN